MKFNFKSFNAEAFGKYVGRVPQTKKNELVKSKALKANSDIRTAFDAQTGTAYAILPMYGLLDGAALNYDGVTDITATSTTTFERGVVVVGRAKAWTEGDFAEDITGGAGFMDNVAVQVAEYWDTIDQATLLSILKGIFSMTSANDLKFVNGHTLDISSKGGIAAYAGAATLNQAIQQASGDNKNKFKIAIMHSSVATNLENLKLLAYLKQTDANGIERELGLGTWNGRTVLIDDSMPTEEIEGSAGTAGVYTLTISTALVATDTIVINGITYTAVAANPTAANNEFLIAEGATATAVATALVPLIETNEGDTFTIGRTAAAITFTQIENGIGNIPSVSTTGTGVAAIVTTTPGVDPTEYTKYTTYVLGEGAFDYENIGAKVPYEMSRDPKTSGGQDTLYSRQRKCFAPYGISYVKKSQASLSPTDAELENGANWALVNDGAGKYIDHKAIPIARIISKG